MLSRREVEADAGEIRARPNGLTVGYLPAGRADPHRTHALRRGEPRLRISAGIADGAAGVGGGVSPTRASRGPPSTTPLSRPLQRGPRPRSRIGTATASRRRWTPCCAGLGFEGTDFEKPTETTFSGGLADAHRALAKLLLRRPPGCCCSTSPPTTSTSRRATGSRSSWSTIPTPWCSSPTIRYFLDSVVTENRRGRPCAR